MGRSSDYSLQRRTDRRGFTLASPSQFAGNMNAIETLDEMCDCVMQISAGTQGRLTTWRGQQASLLFAKLGATCMSFLRVIPGSRFNAAADKFYLWDLSAAASLCRNLIEAYYVLFYLNTEPADEEEREFQEALWEFHASSERHEMFLAALPDSTKLPSVAASLVKKRERLEKSGLFQKQTPQHQKILLSGKKFKLPDNIELSRAAGISEKYFRSQYKYCCTFAHSSPFSISQLDSLQAGTPEAEQLFRMLANLATGYTALAIRDFTQKHPDQQAALSGNVRKCIAIWEDTLRWEKSSSFNVADPT